jgi:hypothetical protein|tara:strand:+ start:277 stop:675 length:399 start_codon:yes stop_codon:yes gene_type:complete
MLDTFKCLSCGQENKNKRNTTNTYCNNRCQQDYQYQQRIANWKDTGKVSKTAVKKYLAEEKEGCWTCGITEHNNKPIVLELEHINGNSQDDSAENLSLICPNCHSQTDTYKGKNKGNGRHYRRVRYSQGKSF